MFAQPKQITPPVKPPRRRARDRRRAIAFRFVVPTLCLAKSAFSKTPELRPGPARSWQPSTRHLVQKTRSIPPDSQPSSINHQLFRASRRPSPAPKGLDPLDSRPSQTRYGPSINPQQSTINHFNQGSAPDPARTWHPSTRHLFQGARRPRSTTGQNVFSSQLILSLGTCPT